MQRDALGVEQAQGLEQDPEALIGERRVDAADEEHASVGRQAELSARPAGIFDGTQDLEVERNREDLRRQAPGDEAFTGLAGGPLGRREQDGPGLLPDAAASGGLAGRKVVGILGADERAGSAAGLVLRATQVGMAAAGDMGHIDLPEDDAGPEGLGNLPDDRGGDEGAGPVDDDEVPLLRAGARVADDRSGRKVRFGVEIVDSDRLEVKAAQLGPDTAEAPGELLPGAQQSTGVDHRRDVMTLPLDDVGDRIMPLSEQRAMDPHEAVGGAAAAVHLGEVENLHPCEGDKTALAR